MRRRAFQFLSFVVAAMTFGLVGLLAYDMKFGYFNFGRDGLGPFVRLMIYLFALGMIVVFCLCYFALAANIPEEPKG